MIFSRKNNDAPGRAEVGALYDKHAPWLLAVCMRYTGNREDAEDVLHDGFMKVIRSVKDFKDQPTGCLEAWMRRIIVNTALNYLRDHKKERMFTGLEEGHQYLEDDVQVDEGGWDLSKEQLMNLLCGMPAGYRTVFNMYVMENYSHKEIAGMLGISENTSKTQLLKARNYLKKRLLENKGIKTYENAESNR